MRLESQHRLALVTLGLVFLLGLQPRLAFSTESCAAGRPDRPVAESGDESGIGGTGIQDARPDRMSSPDDDSESGIGGTGIFGTVTNLDRLCVNGLEIKVPDQVLAQTSNGGATDGALAVGMVVWIRAKQSEDGLVADEIRIDPGLTGVVESVASEGFGIVISGQTVLLPDEARRAPGVAIESPVIGQRLVVYGLRDEREVLVASRIEVAHERDSSDGSGALARWLAESGPLHSLSIEGYVTGGPEKPRLSGLELEFPASTREIQRASFRPGLRMTAEGRISKEGVFRIERSTRLDRPRRAKPTNRKTTTTPETEAMTPTSDGRPDAPQSNPSSSTKSERPLREEIERNGRRPPTPPTPPTPPRIDRPRSSRPSIERPAGIDVQRLR